MMGPMKKISPVARKIYDKRREDLSNMKSNQFEDKATPLEYKKK